jgi:flagellar basal-body rod protein FlgB
MKGPPADVLTSIFSSVDARVEAIRKNLGKDPSRIATLWHSPGFLGKPGDRMVRSLLPVSGMEISRPSQQIMEAALELRSARAELLAGNVANADTPGYRARDINFEQALQTLLGNGGDHKTSPAKALMLENLRYDGNDVDPNQELARAYENSLDYVATLKLYGDSVGRLKSALASS